MATLISDCIDELLMNAIFDAPMDHLGKHAHQNTPRNSILDLDGKNTVEVKLVFPTVIF